MMIYVKLLGPVVVLLAALINIALQENWRKLDDARTTAHKRVVSCLILLIAIGTIITCMVVWKDATTAENLAAEVRLKTQRIIDLAETNVVLSSEISTLNRKQTVILTGGRNYCYFQPFVNTESNMIWYLILQNPDRDAPLYDVKGRIQDVAETMRLCKDPPNPQHLGQYWKEIKQSTKPFFLETLTDADFSSIYREENVGERQWGLYKISFQARNGRWEEMLAFARASNKWYVAYKIKPYHPGHPTPTAMEPTTYIQSGFPTNVLDVRIISDF